MIRSLAFNLFYYIFTLIWATLLLLTIPLPGRTAMSRGIRLWSRIIIAALRLIAGIRVEVRGSEHLEQGKALILVSKHMSDLDPIVVYGLLPDMTALAKKELFLIPAIGQLLWKLDITRIDRQAGTAHQEMPRVVAHIHEQGRPLVVYPEGTRTRPGERRKLKSGAFYLQQDGRLKAIPVATNSGLHWPKGATARRPGTVIYEFGAPLPHETDKASFMRHLEEQVIGRSQQLLEADPLWRLHGENRAAASRGSHRP